MATIYCIEDINGLKYVGSTIQKLHRRLLYHKIDKPRTSSSKLDINNSKIYELEKCELSKKKERERYWINKIECVNIYKLNYNEREYKKHYNYINREKAKKISNLSYHYKASWGGDKRSNNNLLEIDVDLFNY